MENLSSVNICENYKKCKFFLTSLESCKYSFTKMSKLIIERLNC